MQKYKKHNARLLWLSSFMHCIGSKLLILPNAVPTLQRLFINWHIIQFNWDNLNKKPLTANTFTFIFSSLNKDSRNTDCLQDEILIFFRMKFLFSSEWNSYLLQDEILIFRPVFWEEYFIMLIWHVNWRINC